MVNAFPPLISAARAKKTRIELVRSSGLIEISTSANRKIVWYYAKILIMFKIIMYFYTN